MLNVGKFYGAGIEPPLGGFLNDGKTVHVLIDAVVLAAETSLTGRLLSNSDIVIFFSGELARRASAGGYFQMHCEEEPQVLAVAMQRPVGLSSPPAHRPGNSTTLGCSGRGRPQDAEAAPQACPLGDTSES